MGGENGLDACTARDQFFQTGNKGGQIAARANMTKAAAERSLNAMLESVQEMLAEDGKLTLTGFGTFVAETRQERQGRNPRTGDVITIAASKVVRFRPGKMLKDALNK